MQSRFAESWAIFAGIPRHALFGWRSQIPRAGFLHRARCLMLLGVLSIISTGSSADGVSVVVSKESPAEVVFDWVVNRCDLEDIPDEPARVFRDANGILHLFSSHHQNRASVGRSFSSLVRDCSIVFNGRHSDNPADFSDRQWLTSFITLDGKRIISLTHNEYWGYQRKEGCKIAQYSSCWYNAIQSAFSEDGGWKFLDSSGPNSLVAAPPFVYKGSVGHPTGYFQPSNVVYKDGFYYVMFHAEKFESQGWGECVARSSDPFVAGSWRGWNGSSFSVVFVNPYELTSADKAEDHTCTTIGYGKFFDVGSLLFDSSSGQFWLLSFIPKGKGSKVTPPGAYISKSHDLIEWSEPSIIATTLDLDDGSDNPEVKYGYYSLIDHNSSRLMFDDISEKPALYLYYVQYNKIQPPYSRVLLRRRLMIKR